MPKVPKIDVSLRSVFFVRSRCMAYMMSEIRINNYAPKLLSKDIIQRLAAQLCVFETQLTESGDIFSLMDKTDLVFNFQQGGFYVRPDIDAT